MEDLEKTIKGLQECFNEAGLTFDGKVENFWAMMNDKEIQKVITQTMKEKIDKANNTPVQNLLSGRFHC